jgi:hypothetical protein
VRAHLQAHQQALQQQVLPEVMGMIVVVKAKEMPQAIIMMRKLFQHWLPHQLRRVLNKNQDLGEARLWVAKDFMFRATVKL